MMQEVVEMASREAEWVRRLAENNRSFFSDVRNVKVIKEPQSASHCSCVYDVGGVRVNVKLFGKTRGRINHTYEPKKEMFNEFQVLKEYEKKGFCTGRYQVVRALGVCEELDCALATMYADGISLQQLIIEVASGKRNAGDLYMGLEMQAGLLRRIHTEMPASFTIDTTEMFFSYMKSILYLEELGLLDGYHRRIMKGMTRWFDFPPLFNQRGVTVHGDANPSNFKINNGIIYAFDLERSKPRRSPALDLGTIVGELRHQFGDHGKGCEKADPYVRHFLSSYAKSENELKGLLEIMPFFVSQSLFKIAMLGYWSKEHRRYLLEEGTRQIEVKPG